MAVAAEGNAFLSVTPPSLNFTAADWRQAQTVTVTAQDDGNDVAESSSVSHTASGGGYDGVSGSLPVSVEGETAVRTSGAPETRTTTYVVEGAAGDGDGRGRGCRKGSWWTSRAWGRSRRGRCRR